MQDHTNHLPDWRQPWQRLPPVGFLGLVALSTLFIILIAVRTTSPWQEPSYPFRIPVIVESTSSNLKSGSVAEAVIQRDALPQTLKTVPVEIAAGSADGSIIQAILGPQQSSSPIVVWLKPLGRPLPNQAYLYLRSADHTVTPADLPDPFYYFDPTYDPYTDPDISDWEPIGLRAVGLIPLASHDLVVPTPEPAGFTIEAETNITNRSTQPAIGLFTDTGRIIVWQTDPLHWQVRVTGPHPFVKAIPVADPIAVPALLRLDVPQTQGESVRFFLNGALQTTIPLTEPLAGPPQLAVTRTNTSGTIPFFFVTVRPYQQDDPTVTLGSIQTKP